MKIDMEQFLALTMVLGCAGAVSYAVYADRAERNDVIAGVESVDAPPAEAEPSAAQETVAAVVAPMPIPAAPSDRDEAAGIPPVVPDDPGSDAPGPTSEMDPWR